VSEIFTFVHVEKLIPKNIIPNIVVFSAQDQVYVYFIYLGACGPCPNFLLKQRYPAITGHSRELSPLLGRTL
jgi:hypothetical protein